MALKTSDKTRAVKLLRKWTKALELDPPNWTTDINIVPSQDMDGADGSCTWQGEYREAWIDLNEEILGNWGAVEETVVHELLHLKLQGHQDPDKVLAEYDPFFENALNVIARELVKVGRRKTK